MQTFGSIGTRTDAILRANVSTEECFYDGVTLIHFPVDYNSWIESDRGRKLADSLDKDVVLAEGSSSPISVISGTPANFVTGYKEYNTGREYLVKLGDWRNNKDEEVELDGVGGVNILVKADVHRSGMQQQALSTPSSNKP